VTYTTGWPDNTTAKEQRIAIDGIHEAGQVLRDYAPDGGAYINEADVYEPDHEASFSGTANAARLKEIKAKYDPNNCVPGVAGYRLGWCC
jgi:Berberine and berberine like